MIKMLTFSRYRCMLEVKILYRSYDCNSGEVQLHHEKLYRHQVQNVSILINMVSLNICYKWKQNSDRINVHA